MVGFARGMDPYKVNEIELKIYESNICFKRKFIIKELDNT